MAMVFIGTDEGMLIPQKVLQYSILQRTRRPVQFVPMMGAPWEYDDQDLPVGTKFSFRRWMIPQAMDWDGEAYYLDADQIVLRDLAELEELCREPTPSVLRCTYQSIRAGRPVKPQTSVMWINCAQAKGLWSFEIDKILERAKKWNRAEYAMFMEGSWLYPQPAKLPVEWNCLDRYRPQESRLVHFTKADTAPWSRPTHVLAGLWSNELKTALQRGYITRGELEASLALWEKGKAMQGLHPHYQSMLKFAVA